MTLACCIAIYNLSANSKVNKAEFGRVGALETLIRVASVNVKNTAIVIEAVVSYANISMSKSNRMSSLPRKHVEVISDEFS